MKVNVINEYRVEMELEENELSDFDITYDTMDYADVNTRRFLRELAENAREYGVEADMSGKVLIEAFRVSGGCRLCFTFLPCRGKDAPSVKQLVKKDMTCFCAESGDLRTLCEFCVRLNEEPESSLYRARGGYALYLSVSPELLDRCSDTAAEACLDYRRNASFLLARSRENGVCVLEHDAVRTLADL